MSEPGVLECCATISGDDHKLAQWIQGTLCILREREREKKVYFLSNVVQKFAKNNNNCMYMYVPLGDVVD